jgi:hypothetical protein
MVHESTTKVGSVIVALALLGMVGLSVAPSAQAAEGTTEDGAGSSGACITIYTDPVGAAVDPRNCETPVTTNETASPPAP